MSNDALRIERSLTMDELTRSRLRLLIPEILGDWDGPEHDLKLRGRKVVLAQIGLRADVPVGFKLGFGVNDTVFYSWLGGVLPAHRNMGVGDLLMRDQHAWCKDQGFKIVRTKSRDRWAAQIRMNYRHGFTETEREPAEIADPKITFEKSLTVPA